MLDLWLAFTEKCEITEALEDFYEGYKQKISLGTDTDAHQLF